MRQFRVTSNDDASIHISIGVCPEYNSRPRCGNNQSPDSTSAGRQGEARLVRGPRVAQADASAEQDDGEQP